ncbi:acyl carrier protein [Actinoplanes teichomyceticus]|uniref:Acyl carrier protein n=1 Tax=Actinoplanes teichomyceticus TaxID=1867 RepID=A0A561VIB2_ACTTI|nr:acyl carrier protein [Actinoplanes teichomyceticus]TWG11314.1 acyl carrier protein [Actinoplanes teichomyceticus]GIF16345.1 hypothetical protein Ate01nite_63770 [Actinoplanes teichomyceticus]
MNTIRELLVELTGTAEFADSSRVSDDTNLAASGIDSGDMVRLVLLVEQRAGVEVTAADMEKLQTIADYERFVAERSMAGTGGA